MFFSGYHRLSFDKCCQTKFCCIPYKDNKASSSSSSSGFVNGNAELQMNGGVVSFLCK